MTSYRSIGQLVIAGVLLFGCASSEEPVVLIDSLPATIAPSPSSPVTFVDTLPEPSDSDPVPTPTESDAPAATKRPGKTGAKNGGSNGGNNGGNTGGGTSNTEAPADSTPSEIGPSGPASATGSLDASIDGLGEARFGDDAQDTIGYFAEQFGPPTSDSGWGPNQAPCENMGTRVRILSWNDEAFVYLATGPTETVQRGDDHFSAFSVSRGFAGAQRITINGVTVLDRPVSDLQSELPGVTAFDSEIEGPVWALTGDRVGGVSGGTADGVTTSLRAGLFCID